MSRRQNPEETWDYWVREIEERKLKQKNAAALLINEQIVAIGEPPHDRFFVLHPSTVIDSGWQVSMFDRHGPFSHVEGENIEDVALLAFEDWSVDDIRPMTEREFMAITATDEFRKGVLSNQFTALSNLISYEFGWKNASQYTQSAQNARSIEEAITILEHGIAELRKQRGEENPSDLEWLEQLAEDGYGEFAEYYPASAAGELEPSDPYYGRNVIWDGISGRMIRIVPDYARAIEGNIFDADKLAAIVSGIKEALERVVFTAPYGNAHVVTLQDVKESIEYADDYPDHVLTTGDDELDSYLVFGDDYILGEYGEDEFDQVKRDLEDQLAKAVDEDQGDLGELTFQIRDGNHRAFGAMIAGEPYVYMILGENQFHYLDPNDPADQRILEALE